MLSGGDKSWALSLERRSRQSFVPRPVIVMGDWIDHFARWWNNLAQRNGKLKFRTQREAAEFVRHVQNENGGPNAKIIAMRKRYEDATRAKHEPEPDKGGHKAVLR
jgi:hypothetical protein